MPPARYLIAISLLLGLVACEPLMPATPTSPSALPTATPCPTSTHSASPASTPSPTPNSPLPTPVAAPPGNGDDLLALLADPPLRPFDYTIVNPEPPRLVPNATRAFWIHDRSGGEREVGARLRVQTAHVSMWVEDGVWHDVRELERGATFFETQIYSTTRSAFGSEWTPGVDNDPHIHVLYAANLGDDVLGYTSCRDEFPRGLYPHSNQAEMITLSAARVQVNSPAYYGLLARQFQRLVQWYQDRNEERWVKEGLAELSVRLNDLDTGTAERAYLEHPDTSLVTWGEKIDAPHRGAASLFATYFHERFGDAGTRALAAQPLDGIAGFEATLADLGQDMAFEDIFAGWLAANYVPGAEDNGYATLDLERPAPAAIYERYPATMESSVQQFGADYILLHGDADLRLRFTGTPTASLLGVSPHSGHYFWWSGRADESLTTLTRAFDLSGVERATLTYWTWYDLEPGYDYVTLQVSADGGEQWQPLPTPSGSDADPHGNSPGWSYTGASTGWVHEEVDLTPWAGGQVWVRFAYLTDEATTGTGFLLDDVAIPEIGYTADAESSDGGWEGAGFARTTDTIAQRYLALLIGLGDPITVEQLPLEGWTAEWTVPLGSADWREAVLVLSGLAPLTATPARYELGIDPL